MIKLLNVRKGRAAVQIRQDMIISNTLPPIRVAEGECCNVVLALHSDTIYFKNGSNSYIPKWAVVNTQFYHSNPGQFVGWIDLEDIKPPY